MHESSSRHGFLPDVSVPRARAVERNGSKVNSNNDNFNTALRDGVSTALVAGAREGLPERATLPNPYEVAEIDLSHDGRYGWRVVSDCGVVKVYSTCDDCMLAVNSFTARRIADELAEALRHAADATDIRGYGYIVDREGRRAS